MLNILKKRIQTSRRYHPVRNLKSEFLTLQGYKEQNKPWSYWNRTDMDEYKNITYYPYSTKEWFSSIYSYNKTYIKPLISINKSLYGLFSSYFNMLQDKIRLPFKRRRPNKIRYSAIKIFTSRAELKHTNNIVKNLLFMYNKHKLYIERSIRNLVIFTYNEEKVLNEETSEDENKTINKLVYNLKNKIYNNKKKMVSFVYFKTDNILKKIKLKLKKRYFFNTISLIYKYSLKEDFKEEKTTFDNIKPFNDNNFKSNNVGIHYKNLGLQSLISKMYDKYANIKAVALKSLHLNSDVFSSAVALKLRDRKNKAVNILRRAIYQIVKIPFLHTLITFDDLIQTINKNNIINVLNQQVVSGVRFEAAGRLTRRLTAMRSVFKYRYLGSLKNIRSSLNNKSSTILRGLLKSNGQFSNIDSKTRNGSFTLKCWVSSHSFFNWFSYMVALILICIICLLILYVVWCFLAYMVHKLSLLYHKSRNRINLWWLEPKNLYNKHQWETEFLLYPLFNTDSKNKSVALKTFFERFTVHVERQEVITVIRLILAIRGHLSPGLDLRRNNFMTYIKNDNIEAKEMYILLSLIFTYLFWIYKRNLKGENLVLGNTQRIYWDLSIHTTLTTIKLLVELNKLLYKTAGVNISLNKDIIDLIEKISSGNK